jgi:hypothetical protein
MVYGVVEAGDLVCWANRCCNIALTLVDTPEGEQTAHACENACFRQSCRFARVSRLPVRLIPGQQLCVFDCKQIPYRVTNREHPEH